MFAPLLASGRPFAVLQRRGDDHVHLLTGEALHLTQLEEIPRGAGPAPGREVFDTVSAIPFSQIRERGYAVRDDGAPILCLRVEGHEQVPREPFLAELPREPIELAGPIDYHPSREEFAGIIRRVIDREIGNGEGANFVIPRAAEARIEEMTPAKAATIFGRILAREYGSYWSFLFHDGERFLLGATPERHLLVRRGTVRMNPISGTFRKRPEHASLETFKREFLEFLRNGKEIYELFMVVDEELKMMSRLCDAGGMIIGPLIKEMSNLVHTEYLLTGRSALDPIDLLRGSMFAATVTGSPIESACRVIHKYEPAARRYYASALALLGREPDGSEFLDSPIMIRTLEIDPEGRAVIQAGATLVRDSEPEYEVQETESKAAAVLSGLTNAEARAASPPLWPLLHGDDEVAETLQARNQHLSHFWFLLQDAEEDRVAALEGRSVVIIDHEDDFCHMLAHMLRRMGCRVEVERHEVFELTRCAAELVVVGPGPGNPADDACPKMRRGLAVVEGLLATERPLLAVCLGHQLLCRALGLEIIKKRNPYQGIQESIDYFGVKQRVGFYNTFAGRWDPALPDVEAAADPETGEIHALRGPHFLGLQFHAESILTKYGYTILRDAVLRLLGAELR